jgi:DUF1680 family protein
VPGHEEIELALVKLYNVTNDERYLHFAAWLLEERGHGHGSKGDEGDWNPLYYQDDKPVREMTDIAGHAVRAMYLYCGMADVAAIQKDSDYIRTLNRLWDDVALRNMYVTGGIGSSKHNEGFTEDYDLPNYEAYCETCASVGMVYWNARMNLFSGDSKYIDVLERSLYNGTLAGVSLAGDRFFYVNPLASHGDHHRQAWYGCACCPSQVSRFLPSVGNYIYGVSADALWVNLYIGNTAEFDVNGKQVKLRMQTRYPWEGQISLEVVSVSAPLTEAFRLRLPGWNKAYTLTVNGETLSPTVDRGYAVVNREWKAGDLISLTLDMPVEVIASDPQVKANAGLRALQRGPLVYCLEEADNPTGFDRIALTPDHRFSAEFTPDLNGIVRITATGKDGRALFIPYYCWDNRQAGGMKVWVDYVEH